jgi:hypothetical protein
LSAGCRGQKEHTHDAQQPNRQTNCTSHFPGFHCYSGDLLFDHRIQPSCMCLEITASSLAPAGKNWESSADILGLGGGN